MPPPMPSMILAHHPDAPDAELWAKLSEKARKGLLWARLPAIGYWKSSYTPELPDPADFVDAAWDPEARAAVVAYLRGAPRVASWLGVSTCRFCGVSNGSTDLSDGVYVWPEGFAHYVAFHRVRPPAGFAAHCCRS